MMGVHLLKGPLLEGETAEKYVSLLLTLKMDIKGLSLTDFKSKLKELMKPMRFKHFNVGHKLNNQLHARRGNARTSGHITPHRLTSRLEVM